MQHLLDETRSSFQALASREHVALSTVWRWALKGVRGVRLEWFSVGGKRVTTLEAFERFVAATTAAARPGHGQRFPHGESARDDRIEQAEKLLDELDV